MNYFSLRLVAVLGWLSSVGILSIATNPLPGQPPDTLPVFRLATPKGDDEKALQRLAKAFAIDTKAKAVGNDRLRIVASKRMAELYKTSGGLWAADGERLWNPELIPEKLPDPKTAGVLAEAFLKENDLLPKSSPEIVFVRREETPSTLVAWCDDKSDRTLSKLDIQVNYVAQVKVTGPQGKPTMIPVVGGGGEFNVTLGDKGKVIGYSGVWRSITQTEHAKLVPKSIAHKAAEKMLGGGGMKVVAMQSSLAYYSAPASQSESVLYPVWVVRAGMTSAGRSFSARTLLFSATEVTPDPKPLAKAKRTADT
jgi:hypothetical protein